MVIGGGGQMVVGGGSGGGQMVVGARIFTTFTDTSSLCRCLVYDGGAPLASLILIDGVVASLRS